MLDIERLRMCPQIVIDAFCRKRFTHGLLHQVKLRLQLPVILHLECRNAKRENRILRGCVRCKIPAPSVHTTAAERMLKQAVKNHMKIRPRQADPVLSVCADHLIDVSIHQPPVCTDARRQFLYRIITCIL